MNLFLLGLNLSQSVSGQALTELGNMVEVYPQLDLTTCSHTIADNGGVFAATMHSPAEAVTPRRYVWKEEGEITLYDGVIFDSSGSFAAHDARELARNWQRLPEKLDGQFVVARVTQKPAAIEVMTDILGYAQVYYCQQGDTWLISNSVRPLVRLCRAYDLDPLGVSMFLSQTWVWDDRTLHQGIRTIPAGQLWKFEEGTDKPIKHIYCSAAALAPHRKQRLSPAEVKNLAEKLIHPCRILNESLGPLRCGITGGKDSRVVMSLLVNGQIPGIYFTSGDPETSKDIKIARFITKKLNLPHEIRDLTRQDAIGQWDVLCKRLVRQGDGMISLWQLPDVLNQPQQVDRLSISLSGLGGEIARNSYYNPLEAMQKHRPEDIEQMVVDALVFDYGGLILPEAKELSAKHLCKTIQESLDQGLSGLDVLDTFYAYQRAGRWAGSNRKKICPVYDAFAPLCTRPFLEAMYKLSPAYRSCYWLHRQLLRLLMPELAGLAFDKGRARPQWPLLNLLLWALQRSLNKGRRYTRRLKRRRASGRTKHQPPEFGQVAWLENKREWMRQICLDQRDSMLWNFANRAVFEQLMSPSGDPTLRGAYRLGIYGILTLFYYTAIENRNNQ